MSPRVSLALGLLASLAAIPQASAGSCCQQCAAPCATPWVPAPAYYYGTQFYVVNEGPTYTGPGIVTLPPNYPYVGGDCCARPYGGPYPIMPVQPYDGGY